MTDTVALNEVVRVLGLELSKNDERVLIGSTQEEKDVLEKHSNSGKRRAVLGFFGGSTICAGAWKALGGQRRLLGGLTMASGGMAGFMYGILSIRRGLFEDILTLPSDKSPFAHRARQILDEQLPNNAFYLEVKELLKQKQVETGSWDAVPSFTAFKDPANAESTNDYRGFDRAEASSTSSSQLPRLPPLPQSENDEWTSEQDAFSTPSSSSSLFFFGESGSRDSSDKSSPPSSYDYYGSRPPVAKKPQDDDPYYNDTDGWGNEDDKQKQPKPVTWEELRRRAASGKQ